MHGSTVLVKNCSAMSHDSVFRSIRNDDASLEIVQNISKFVVDSGKENSNIQAFKPTHFQVDGTTMLGLLTLDKMDSYRFTRTMTLTLSYPNSMGTRIYSDACAFLVDDVFSAESGYLMLFRGPVVDRGVYTDPMTYVAALDNGKYILCHMEVSDDVDKRKLFSLSLKLGSMETLTIPDPESRMRMKIVNSNTQFIKPIDKSRVYDVDEVKDLCLSILQQSRQGTKTTQSFTCARCSLPMHMLD